MNKIQSFTTNIDNIEIPSSFTFPFFYRPHILTQIAKKEVIHYLAHSDIFNQNNEKNIGKMFGVLIVKDQEDKLKYITAFSGELLNQSNDHIFVPPINIPDNIRQDINELKQKVEILNNKEESLLNSPEIESLKKQLITLKQNHSNIIQEKIEVNKKNKILRNQSRTKDISNEELKKLNHQSSQDKQQLKDLRKECLKKEHEIEIQIDAYKKEINLIKSQRVKLLNQRQDLIFKNLFFLNGMGENKDLFLIFEQFADKKPNSGTGECAAPKLLNYAYMNNLKPIAMGEFWYGKPHNNRIRVSGNFYPSCSSRCRPLLGHMLKGLQVEEDPLLINYAKDEQVHTIYQDDYLIALNKPYGLLSVRGRNIEDSIESRFKDFFIIHRLDQETSGIILMAKTKQIQSKMQKLFAQRKIQKRYIAFLNGKLQKSSGEINLPLKPDYSDLPFQQVCTIHGKPAYTKYEVISEIDTGTLVYLWPKTGRTHQLRVHCAHHLGLNTPILDDDLYGVPGRRLRLHANKLEFHHPITHEFIVIESNPPEDFDKID